MMNVTEGRKVLRVKMNSSCVILNKVRKVFTNAVSLTRFDYKVRISPACLLCPFCNANAYGKVIYLSK